MVMEEAEMTTITLDDLRRIMRESAGADESVDLDGDIAAVPFEELGYDSLALLEMSAVVRQEFDVVVPDGALEHSKTPQDAVDLINQLVAAR
jgi:act minimal PKS acyl carrier protein